MAGDPAIGLHQPIAQSTAASRLCPAWRTLTIAIAFPLRKFSLRLWLAELDCLRGILFDPFG